MVSGKGLYRTILKIVTWILMGIFIIGGIAFFITFAKWDEAGLGALIFLGCLVFGFLSCLFNWFVIEIADNIAGTTDNLVLISSQLAEISGKLNPASASRSGISAAEASASSSIGTVNAVVEAVGGSLVGQKLNMSANQTITIGRDSAACQFVLQANGISRKHCTVYYNASINRFVITDFSTNGTFLNGTRIQPGVPVEAGIGSKITLGQTAETFVLR